MTRRPPNPVSPRLRRVFRWALSLSLVSGPTIFGASGANAFDGANTPEMPTAIDLPAFPEIPELPGAANSQREITASPRSVARTVLVQRWLGLGHRSQFHSPTANEDLKPSVPAQPAYPLPAMGVASYPQGETIGLPPIPEASSRVIAASAEESAGGVMESFSDMTDTESLGEQPTPAESFSSHPIDPLDLLNSLEEQESPVDGNPSEALSMNFSDQMEAPAADQATSREPQIVKSNQSLSLLSQTSSRSTALGSTSSNESNSSDCLNSCETLAAGQPQDPAGLVSSRRSTQPEPMKIQILGQTDQQATPAQRAPLVAMLAGYSSLSRPEVLAEQAQSLQQLIQTEPNPAMGPQPDSTSMASTNLPDQLPSQSSEQFSGPTFGPSSDQSLDSSLSTESQSNAEPTEATGSTAEPEATIVETQLHFTVGPRGSLQLTSGNRIVGVSVEQEEICQLIQTGPRSYSLIGVREGHTRVALITEVSGQRQIEIQQVTVDPRGTTGSDLSALAESITQTIRQLYPHNRVQVAAQGRQLFVSGKVDSEESARRILSLVRKTSLTPVVDQLTTY